MSLNFRKPRIGFVNLILSFLEGQDKAVKLSSIARDYMEKKLDVEVVEYPEPLANRSQAVKAWKMFQAENVDAVILFNGTFSTGELTAEIIRNLNCPFALWGLGELALDNKNFTGSMVGVMAAGALFKNLGKKFSFIYGPVEREEAQRKLGIFVRVVRAIAYLKEATIAVVGMRPDGFEISDYDELAIKKLFGTEITKLSLYTLSKIMKEIDESEIDRDMNVQKSIFTIKKEDEEEARGLSKLYLALKRVVKEKNIQSYAPDCWPELRDIDKTPICPANGRMNVEGVMASCECDVDGSLTLMLEHALTGSTPWWADFVNLIEKNDTLLWWHCGNAPYNLSTEKPVIERIFGGLSQTAALKEGTATICRLNSIRGEFTIHAGVGEVVKTEPLLKGSNLCIRMKGGNMEFMESMLEHGIPHHNGIVYGDILAELKEFARLMDIPIIIHK
ncbi:MAG: L-fucose/L-arabinose isomerase family protein [Spirochaetota bacterium]